MPSETGKDWASLDIEALMSIIVEPCLAAVEDEEDSTVLTRDKRQSRCRIHEER